MKIQLIRNATMKIQYAGRTILTDPMFVGKGTLDPFAGIARNPTIELPLAASEVAKDLDCILVSHTHPDHFDQPASAELSRSLSVLCQPGDESHISDEGFSSVQAIDRTHQWGNISITRTGGQHGTGEILKMMGEVSGFVLQADNEPTVYWVGDCIWGPEIQSTIDEFRPDVIITHSGAATIPGHEAIIMDGEQTLITTQAAPKATVVAIHLESLDHCGLTRQQLRQQAKDADVSKSRLLIPEDGEILEF